jgi:hypothetical protein
VGTVEQDAQPTDQENQRAQIVVPAVGDPVQVGGTLQQWLPGTAPGWDQCHKLQKKMLQGSQAEKRDCQPGEPAWPVQPAANPQFECCADQQKQRCAERRNKQRE